MSGARHRRKGNRVERELVQLHKALGVHAERYPLSGASRFRGSGHDVEIYVFGPGEGPLVAEVKSRRSGMGSQPWRNGWANTTASFCVETVQRRWYFCHGGSARHCLRGCANEYP